MLNEGTDPYKVLAADESIDKGELGNGYNEEYLKSNRNFETQKIVQRRERYSRACLSEYI